jgi:hypothetical protein
MKIADRSTPLRYSIFEPELSKLDLKNAWGVTALSSSNRPFPAMTLSFLSSRAKQRDLRFRGPLLETRNDKGELVFP